MGIRTQKLAYSICERFTGKLVLIDRETADTMDPDELCALISSFLSRGLAIADMVYGVLTYLVIALAIIFFAFGEQFYAAFGFGTPEYPAINFGFGALLFANVNCFAQMILIRVRYAVKRSIVLGEDRKILRTEYGGKLVSALKNIARRRWEFLPAVRLPAFLKCVEDSPMTSERIDIIENRYMGDAK